MKKIVLLFSMLFMLGFSTLGLAEAKIGVVDVNRILLSTPQIKNMQTELKNQFDPRGQEIVKLQDTFRSDVERYRKDNLTMKKDMLKEVQQKLVDESKILQEKRMSLQRDFHAARTKALIPIYKQIENAVNKIAQEKKLDLVITKISLAYNASQFEITDQVIAEMSKVNHK